MEIIYNITKINDVVQKVWLQFKQYKVWIFEANMGCGKTTFINTLCKYLHINENSSSPTFSIINEYKSKEVGTVYHIDLYRLKDLEEAMNAGVEEIVNSNNYCFIEWPQIALDILPNEVCKVEIEMIDETTRRLVALEYVF